MYNSNKSTTILNLFWRHDILQMYSVNCILVDKKYYWLQFVKRQSMRSLKIPQEVIRSHKLNCQLVIIISKPFFIIYWWQGQVAFWCDYGYFFTNSTKIWNWTLIHFSSLLHINLPSTITTSQLLLSNPCFKFVVFQLATTDHS